MASSGYSAGIPGHTAARESIEREILWGAPAAANTILTLPSVIVSTAVDSGASPTTQLRPGLIMAQLDASPYKWVDYDPDATTGAQQAKGILLEEVFMLDPITGTVADRVARIMVGGPARGGLCINLDQQARNQLRGRIVFDDSLDGGHGPNYRRHVGVTGNTTVVAADHGSLFIVTGGSGVTFTLPTKAVGLRFEFLNTVDQNMAVASGGSADDIIGIHDVGADSLTFSTSSQKIGARLAVECVYVSTGLKWSAINLSPGVATITAA